MDRLRNVLVTTSTFPRGPDDEVSARFVLDLARHLAKHVRVTVLAPAGPESPAKDTWDGIRIVRHRYFLPERLQLLTGGEGMLAAMRERPLARLQLPFLVASQLLALPRVAHRTGAQVVNSHWIVPQGFNVALWSGLLDVAHVVTAHAADVAYLRRSRLGPSLARFVFDRSDVFLPVSNHLAEEVEAVAGRTVPHRVIPMGVSLSRFHPSSDAVPLRDHPNERIVLFVGKFVPKKGLEVLLDAVSALRARGVPVRAVLVGGGPLADRVRARVDDLELAEAVDLAGWRPNEELPGYYSAADVVCVPSVRDERGETEGMPVVVQEALATGSVIVASEISGIPDVLCDGDNGFLVPPSDPARLARALEEALELDDGSRRSIQGAARRTAREHSWDRVAQRYLEAFDEARARAATDGWS